MDFLAPDRPSLVLAPMQDVTDLPFMRVIARRGAPDWFVTEYFRVYPDSRPDPYILRSITENQTDRPVFAQMIGRDIPALVKTAIELQRHPVAGIDLNLGCPAPVVCRKDAGGGLLRSPETVDAILGALREVIPGRFTVKTRIGYHDESEFPRLLEVFSKHAIDLLTIHGRTVEERYQTPVHPDCVKLAVETLPCPVIANGNVVNIPTGLSYIQKTGAAGLMVGRGAIRNPWIFAQLKAAFAGETPPAPTRRDLLEYAMELYAELAKETKRFNELAHVQRMKKTMVYITQGLDQDFHHRICRAKTPDDFESACRDHLDRDEALPDTPPDDTRLFCGFGELVK
ncbi:tRNA-dihydrouridine synthase [Luteolibacter sp. LG18]|uniref:tRNA dihydrouridine synthase n=1 Tax=Luteolibacter sp. LG18 TaxID=2819286 RepID=UPI002B2EA9D4|nr:tRNA-dihydrouridine synthase [Luteolibacter sp. LG18]